MPFERSFTSSTNSLPEAHAFLEESCVALSVSARLTNRLLVIIDELFVNTLTHGGPASGSITLRLTRVKDGILIRYSDGGVAHDPFATAAPETLCVPLERREIGGLGIVLVRSLATYVAYHRAGARNIIEVTLAD